MNTYRPSTHVPWFPDGIKFIYDFFIKRILRVNFEYGLPCATIAISTTQVPAGNIEHQTFQQLRFRDIIIINFQSWMRIKFQISANHTPRTGWILDCHKHLWVVADPAYLVWRGANPTNVMAFGGDVCQKSFVSYSVTGLAFFIEVLVGVELETLIASTW